MLDFPNKKYTVIYADPPWSYSDKQKAGCRGAFFKYPVQSKEWIESLPVIDIVADDAFLFLWVTMPLLQQGLDLFPKWGFTYKTIGFTWVKKNKKAGSLFWGMGNYTRSNTELCLLGIRGKPKRVSASVHSVIESPIRSHSQKPDEVRDRIVQLCGDVPRIELFARNNTEGWDVFGNEV